MLWEWNSKVYNVPSHITPTKYVHVTRDIKYEEMIIVIIYRQVRKLRNKEVAFVKVLWRKKPTSRRSYMGSKRRNEIKVYVSLPEWWERWKCWVEALTSKYKFICIMD